MLWLWFYTLCLKIARKGTNYLGLSASVRMAADSASVSIQTLHAVYETGKPGRKSAGPLQESLSLRDFVAPEALRRPSPLAAGALANDLKLTALRPLGFSRTSPYRSKLLTSLHEKSPALCAELQIVCGEGGIRTPGTFQFNSFQDCRNRPLYRLSFPEKGLQI